MREQRFRAANFLIAGAMGLLSFSMIIAQQTVAGPPLKSACIGSPANACSTCEGTNQVYQCKPATLPTGAIYGTCINVSGNCNSTEAPADQDCGNTDWTCGENSKSIPESHGCLQTKPQVCNPN